MLECISVNSWEERHGGFLKVNSDTDTGELIFAFLLISWHQEIMNYLPWFLLSVPLCANVGSFLTIMARVFFW